MDNIDLEIIVKWEEEFLGDAKNRLAMSAICFNDYNSIIKQRESVINQQHVFSNKVDVEGSPMMDQKASGRCWLFAITNVIRVELMKKYNLKAFQYSQSYLFFWDKFERANFFLQNMIELADQDLDDRVVQHLLIEPVSDGGQYDMLNNLLNKYGLLPQYLYPDSFNASTSAMLNRLINSKLREFTVTLRSLEEAKRTTAKSEMIQEIYGILVIALGRPPKPLEEFTWEYMDKEDVFHSVKTTPVDFYKMTGYDIDEQMSLMNDPRNEYGKKYTIDRLGNMTGGRRVTYVNVEAQLLKDIAIAMIKSNRPVFFGCDVGASSDRKTGIMDLCLLDHNLAFNTVLKMDKSSRIQTGDSANSHAMVLTGVHIVEGKAVRWRVQNSWGEDRGEKGFFVMSDEWMTEYCYQIVCSLKDCPEQLVREWQEGEAVVLPAWDPM